MGTREKGTNEFSSDIGSGKFDQYSPSLSNLKRITALVISNLAIQERIIKARRALYARVQLVNISTITPRGRP